VVQLTDRQLEVLSALVDVGAEYKVAAHPLGITTRTVKAHLAAAKARAGCDSTLQLVAWADDHVPGWREKRPAA